jgi:hypothetical protein
VGVNLVVLIPLTENMPGGAATKPGDVVRAMNGKTIQVILNHINLTTLRLFDQCFCFFVASVSKVKVFSQFVGQLFKLA